MTNDQKFLSLMNQVDDLLKTLDKCDNPAGAGIYRNTVKDQRRNIKIFIIQNRMVVPDQIPVRKAKSYCPNNSSNYKNLAR